ncbi:hypothetical protein TUM4438_41820 [Shewanella sairae]|uniref:Uncharacterized protein n=1 Tax=Shewanella sairae TaxID=190310 RepID=A0ABQ4PQR6_9GAMM|nr:hypothetical protein [Shewanella sairae]MCL1130388.1 hypothetical protein [Shewanella sairae]GIU51598.1 hypothetical protein TUM4438_41820 [Shewanella sairae]
MKFTTLFILLGIVPTTAMANCQIEFEVQEQLSPNTEYKLNYSYKMTFETHDVGALTPFQSVKLNVAQCPEDRNADLSLLYMDNGTEQLSFETRLFPKQSKAIFSHNHTLAYRFCAGCDLTQYSNVAAKVKNKQMGEELALLIEQQPNYLSYNHYAALRTVFGNKVRNISIANAEAAYLTPPIIGQVQSKPPATRDISKQWLNVLVPNKAFMRALTDNTAHYSQQQRTTLLSKVNRISKHTFSELNKTAKGFQTTYELNQHISALVKPLKASTDPSIIQFVTEIESAHETTNQLSHKLDNIKISKGALNDPSPKNIAALPVNWFRLLHTIPSATPEQLAMFSAGFRADFTQKIQQKDDSLASYIAASIKKYSKAMRYVSMNSSDKDKAAYNALLAEVSANNVSLTGKQLSLIALDENLEIQWLFENNSWKLDRFITR